MSRARSGGSGIVDVHVLAMWLMEVQPAPELGTPPREGTDLPIPSWPWPTAGPGARSDQGGGLVSPASMPCS